MLAAHHTRFRVIAFYCLTLVAACTISKSGQAAPPDTGSKPAVIDASDKAAILAAMPHDVGIIGTVSKIEATNSVLTIQFKGAESSRLSAAVLDRNREAVEKEFGERLKSLGGKRVEISGKLTEYRGKPQIVISRPEQLKLPGGSDGTKTDSPEKASARPAIDATDEAAVKAALPHEVTIAGTVAKIQAGDTTIIRFADTESSQFSCVILKRNRETIEKAFGKDLKTLEGKRIQVTGEITDYRGKPQIVISAPKQIAVVDK